MGNTAGLPSWPASMKFFSPSIIPVNLTGDQDQSPGQTGILKLSKLSQNLLKTTIIMVSSLNKIIWKPRVCHGPAPLFYGITLDTGVATMPCRSRPAGA